MMKETQYKWGLSTSHKLLESPLTYREHEMVFDSLEDLRSFLDKTSETIMSFRAQKLQVYEK